MTKKALLISCIAFLIIFYASAALLDLQGISGLIYYVSLLAVIILSVSYGKIAGILAGVAVAAANWFFVSPIDLNEIFSVANAGIIFPVFSGVFFGHYGDVTEKRHNEFVKKLKDKDKKESEYTRKLQDYRIITDRLTSEPAYKKNTDKHAFADNGVERVLGALMEHFPAEEARLTGAGRILAEKCFGLLKASVPGVVAVMDLNGKIVEYNREVFAFLGYFIESAVRERNISLFISEEDRERAAQNLSGALMPGIRNNETYTLTNSSQWELPAFSKPSFKFYTAGNPVSVIAVLVKNDETQFPAYTQTALAKHIWIVSQNGSTQYIAPEMAELLEYAQNDMARYRIFHFLDEQNTKIYADIVEASENSNDFRHNIEIVTKSGSRIFTFIEAFPARNAKGEFAGMALFAENITERKLTEKSLEHRLSIERLIAGISTKFIGAPTDMVFYEMASALDVIGEFLCARESHIYIAENIRTGQEFRHSIHHQRETMGVNEETISIPLMSGGDTLGYFRFVQDASTRAWLEEDINLLRMAGEMFVSSMARKQALDQLKISEEKMRTTLQSIGDAVIATDDENTVIMINKEAQKVLGYTSEEAVGRPLDEVFRIVKGKILSSAELDRMFEEEKDELSMAIFDLNTPVLRKKDGKDVSISASTSRIEDESGNTFGTIYVFRDITERKKKEEEIIYLSFHDKLTGLHNRAFFEVELKRLDVRRQYPLTLLIGDCNGLKITNDIFGHHEGDKLLIKIADIFRSVTRREDIIARWGGDEYAVILPKTPEKTAADIRSRIIQACKDADRSPIQPSISLGSATKYDETQDIVEVLKEAEDRMYRHKLLEDKSNRSNIIASLEKTLIEKSHETEEHAKRMQEFSERIALAIGLSDNEIDDLRLLSVLHDMGKIGIPDIILEKPSSLSEDEWEVMKMHPEKGFSIAESSKELSNIATYILHHHERWDGAGYPSGLKGNDIPKLSRIISIVDTYDVITHSRPYKKALTHEDAMKEIRRCAGTQFDPELVDVFEEIMKGYMKENQTL